jgi:hypothetical protein
MKIYTHQRKKCEVPHSVGVFCHDSFIYANSGIMIDITRFCQSDDGMDEHILNARDQV